MAGIDSLKEVLQVFLKPPEDKEDFLTGTQFPVTIAQAAFNLTNSSLSKHVMEGSILNAEAGSCSSKPVSGAYLTG